MYNHKCHIIFIEKKKSRVPINYLLSLQQLSATDGLGYVQGQYPLMSNHKTLNCEVLYIKECIPLHSTHNKPHHYAQTLGTFLSGLCL